MKEYDSSSRPKLDPDTLKKGIKKGVAAVLGCILVLVLMLVIFNMFEYLDARHIMVIQSPIAGDLTWHTNQGVKWQWFGKVTKYEKRVQFWFSADAREGRKGDESIEIRFNDGGKGHISGSIAWEMPLSPNFLTPLHQKYGSTEAIEHQLIRQIVNKAVYMTGPLMSSMESYASRRNDLLNLIEDQIHHGVFRTESFQEKQKDPMTGAERNVTIVKIVRDSKGLPMRQEESALQEFGLRTFNLTINKIPYDKEVEAQIGAQQAAFMQVQTAIAKAKEAEQKAITVAKEGEATAMKAKWEQETIKAKEVTLAQQKLAVAELAAKEAEQYKRAQILQGEGEATKKKLVMEADGALAIKVDAYKYTVERFADAMAKYQGNWVPQIMTGTSGQSVNAATQMMELLSIKAAKDLGLDMSMPGKEKTVAPLKK